MAQAIPWWANSLLSTLLALIVAVAAVSLDRRKTINQELIRKRIAAYEQMAPLLNDIYFYLFSFGERTELTPADMADRKDRLDRLLKLHAPLFSEKISRCYYHFIDAAFDTIEREWNGPPRIKASLTLHKLKRPDWQPEWDRLFVAGGTAAGGVEFLARYHALMDQFAVEIGARPWRAHWLIRRRKGRRGLGVEWD